MLQDRDGRLFKFGNQIRRGANVENVVKRKLLALKFLEAFVEIAVRAQRPGEDFRRNASASPMAAKVKRRRRSSAVCSGKWQSPDRIPRSC